MEIKKTSRLYRFLKFTITGVPEESNLCQLGRNVIWGIVFSIAIAIVILLVAICAITFLFVVPIRAIFFDLSTDLGMFIVMMIAYGLVGKASLYLYQEIYLHDSNRDKFWNLPISYLLSKLIGKKPEPEYNSEPKPPHIITVYLRSVKDKICIPVKFVD